MKQYFNNISFISKWVILLVLVMSCNGVWSQVNYEIKISSKSVALNERLRVDFEMNADGDNFMPPDFEGFRVVGGPNQAVSMSWLDGEKKFKKTYSFYIKPIRQGKFTIQSSSIEIDNEVYRTKPLVVTVTKPNKKPKDPNSIAFSVADGIHLVSEVSNSRPYINEPITVVHKLYVKSNISVRNWREIDFPRFNDFWSQNIEVKDLRVERGKYKGEDYRYVVLRKNVLYPQKTGVLKLEPLKLEVSVDVPTNRRDIFGGRITTTETESFASKTRTIKVKPLPEKGKPENFSGAVGRFEFEVKPTKTTLKHGESLDVEVKVSGRGNLKLFNLPEPLFPSALEVYDPLHSEKTKTYTNGLRGTISNKYTVIPQFQGSFPVKAVGFTYFDLDTESYRTITSDEFSIVVIDGPNSLDPSNSNEAMPNTDNIVAKSPLDKSIPFKFIKSDSTLVSSVKQDFFGSQLYLSLVALPLCFIPIIILWRKRRERASQDVFGNKQKKSQKLAKKYLSEAKNNLKNKDEFYISLEKALHNFLKAKLQIETSDMRKENIQGLLNDKGVDDSIISRFIELIENCELARYSPSTSVTIQNDYDKAVELLPALSKEI